MCTRTEVQDESPSGLQTYSPNFSVTKSWEVLNCEGKSDTGPLPGNPISDSESKTPLGDRPRDLLGVERFLLRSEGEKSSQERVK